MTPLKPELQGEGTYDYTCRDKECLYCRTFGLIPEPEMHYDQEPIVRHFEPEETPIPRKSRPKTYRKRERLIDFTPPEQKWTEKKVAKLVYLYYKLSDIDLSLRLNVSRYEIKKKAKELGLTSKGIIRTKTDHKQPQKAEFNGWF